MSVHTRWTERRSRADWLVSIVVVALFAVPDWGLAQTNGSSPTGSRKGSRVQPATASKASTAAGATSPGPDTGKGRSLDLEALEKQFQGDDRSGSRVGQTLQAQSSTYRGQATPSAGPPGASPSPAAFGGIAGAGGGAAAAGSYAANPALGTGTAGVAPPSVAGSTASRGNVTGGSTTGVVSGAMPATSKSVPPGAAGGTR